MAWAFNREAWEIGAHWKRVPTHVDVLVTHGPPLGVLDRLEDDSASVGCPLLRERVKVVRPRVHVFGHLHVGHGWLEEDGTCFVNAALCDERNELAFTPIVVDVEAR
ncbi:hypothetical protein [Deinococcus yavapaiensis]|uniref:Calcineurin-like phosphoesterase family protein n=1 Tax=Deinococcus yavapaiensis KR-236 TaxID=694435 RepID=A0A318S571_9DEIO|nr:hypothetical protein [Deinococcus yavapaiensis]PYE48345.1 hypothetical protein DES52_13115 [Deinococcus yavapaiensis KR-236]